VNRIAAIVLLIATLPTAALAYGVDPHAEQWMREHREQAEESRLSQEPWDLDRSTKSAEALEMGNEGPAQSTPPAGWNGLLDARVSRGVEQILDGVFDPMAVY